MPGPTSSIDAAHLLRAARLAGRGHGGAEPNPLVGCVIVAPDGSVVGSGAHMRFGGPHAEIHALGRAGDRARGATAYVTLEPCNHAGKTGPCSEALIDAGVSRVVIARRDPNPGASGGAERLRAAGIAVDVVHHNEAARVSDPFVHRVRTGLPWVMAKWAQTIDGRIATRTGRSRWISGPASRQLVHRERGRVDVVLTSIGTVLADDPLLTARDVRVRRIARRVVIDPSLRTPIDAKLVRTAGDFPTTIACDESVLAGSPAHAERLRAAGVDLMGVPDADGALPLEHILRALVEEHDATNVMVEAGAGLLGRLFREGLVDEAWVFIAPLVLGDAHAVPCVTGSTIDQLAEGVALELAATHQRGGDVLLRYRVRDVGS